MHLKLRTIWRIFSKQLSLQKQFAKIVKKKDITENVKNIKKSSFKENLKVTAQRVRIKLKPMTDCLKFLVDTPRFRGMVSELDCWMEWIENQMAEEMYDIPTEDDMDDFIGGIHEYRSRETNKLS